MEYVATSYSGSMPSNYECKVMVILISCAKRKNGRDRERLLARCFSRVPPRFSVAVGGVLYQREYFLLRVLIYFTPIVHKVTEIETHVYRPDNEESLQTILEAREYHLFV